MSWASKYIEQLQSGNQIKFRPRGNSMSGKIESGQLVTVDPDCANLKIGDIVLCKVKGSVYLHLIKSIKGSQYLIGNNKNRLNGWTNTIFGKVVKIEL